jgi:hypothetical protein
MVLGRRLAVLLLVVVFTAEIKALQHRLQVTVGLGCGIFVLALVLMYTNKGQVQ